LAKDPRIVATTAVVFAVAVVSEIGPGFSPDIKGHHRMGFSPWDMLSCPQTGMPSSKKAYSRRRRPVSVDAGDA